MKKIKIGGVTVNAITKSDMVTITPADANRILQHNDNFRKVNHSEALRYANMINDGSWRFNGDTIAFDIHGNLKDGQHRMRACMQSGKSMKVIPILIDSDMHTDYKRKLSFAHILKSQGKPNACAIAAVTRIIYLHGKVGYERAFTDRGASISTQILWDFYKQTPKIQEAMDFAGSHYHDYRANIPHSMLGAFYYFASQLDEDKAVKFVKAVAMTAEEFAEAGYRKTDPITKLKEYLATDSKAERISPVIKVAHLILAWNHMRENKPCSRLQWVCVGPDAEPFPAII